MNHAHFYKKSLLNLHLLLLIVQIFSSQHLNAYDTPPQDNNPSANDINAPDSTQSPLPNTYLPPMFYNDNMDQDRKRYTSILPAATDDLDMLLETFEHNLPDPYVANKIVDAAIQEHPKLNLILKQLSDPDLFTRAKHPTRLLFIGPSGCGKTTLAEAIAAACDITCIFIKASSIATTYQNSGAQFFELLFRCLKNNPDEDFLVIIDEISAIAQFSSDDKDLQQNKMATSFWLGLDEIRNERHICIIGTDNKDPEKLPDQIKTRFKNNIFYFEPPTAKRIATFMRDCLEQVPQNDNYAWSYKKGLSLKLHTCSNDFLQNLATYATSISLREIEDLIEKAKVLAINESEDPYAPVQEKHMLQAFAEITKPWFKKFWENSGSYINTMFSPRACTLYAAVSGLYMHFYSEKYREHGLFVTALATLINNYLPVPTGQPNDVHLFNSITHMFGNYKYRIPANAPFASDTKND